MATAVRSKMTLMTIMWRTPVGRVTVICPNHRSNKTNPKEVTVPKKWNVGGLWDLQSFEMPNPIVDVELAPQVLQTAFYQMNDIAWPCFLATWPL
jgi:hypothetical protein